MSRKKEMIMSDIYLYNTIIKFTQDEDKIYEIFTKLHNQASWKISDIEELIYG